MYHRGRAAHISLQYNNNTCSLKSQVEGLENPGTTTFQYNPYQVEIDENEGEADADAGQVADPANDEVADPVSLKSVTQR